MSSSDHVARNRKAWDRWASEYVEVGRRSWASDEPSWGMWGIREAELRVLPDVAGLDVIELGCGTAYWSSWLARRGAHPVGIDNSERQLETARALQREYGLDFPLLHGNAEQVPLADASFDLAFSEYGACLWCDPYLWVPEAARLLRPGGRLVFLTNGCLLELCLGETEEQAGERLVRDLFGLHRSEWADEGSVEFHLPHGEWIRLLREHGLAVEALHELRAPADGDASPHEYVALEWARRWPSEEIWVARKQG